MQTTIKPTFKSLNITHILIVNSRGFANERSVWAIPADCVDDAVNFVVSNHKMWEGSSTTRLVPLSDADATLRKAAGRSLTMVDGEYITDYRNELYGVGPLQHTLDI